MMPRSRPQFLSTLAASSLAFRGATAKAAEAFTLRCNVATAPNTMYVLAAIHFAAAVRHRSNGQLNVEVYPSGQLSTQGGTIDALSTGVLDLDVPATSSLIGIAPRYQLFDMPFLYKDLTTCYRMLDGRLGAELLADLAPKGIAGLAWMSGGYRELETATKTVVAPDDINGLRMRVVGGAVYVATYQALGAIPVTVDLSEMFTAIAQHTVDGMDISLDTVALGKYSSIVKHVALTNHALNQCILVGSRRKLEALPSPLQRMLGEEAKAVVPFMRNLAAQRQTDSIESLKKDGVAFNEVQYAAFRKAVDPVYTVYRSRLGSELFDRAG